MYNKVFKLSKKNESLLKIKTEAIKNFGSKYQRL